MKEIIINDEYKDMRLDRFVTKVTNLSKVEIQKLLRKKNIKVNGKKEQGSYRTKKLDKIQFYINEEHFKIEKKVKAVNTNKLDIIYEDENIIIVNKPAAILSQGNGSNKADVVSMLKSYLNTNTTGIITRLDLNTSGIVIAGKNRRSLMLLNEISKKNLIDKRYLTLVYGEFKNEGKITLYGIKDRKQNKLILNKEKINGAFEVSAFFKIKKKYKDYTLLEVKLITGKSHQIRSQLNALGYSVLGDRKYDDNKKTDSNMTLNRQFLHCYKVTIDYDEKYKDIINEKKQFNAPLPKDLEKVISLLEKTDKF